ncbi:16S/23S rRNA (cytidine-2'-O)-methyltransferase TlyA [Pseudolycoriella hygida]|uniref:16S/23S rRNA (Cytidine-2'-O)-methyltransferase TlyA n=1 Tax=Pseudolycoriella hygida TaxID=35572 RepID=A0A9Q0N6X2_9DIPT|nr:16S/23S rRNA (cytidine-2'-O)-methyltransferase TlyA [Pseudolycoriella hygida]
MAKIRLDQYLVQTKLVDNVTLARSLIIQGKVYINQQVNTKAGTQVTPTSCMVTIKYPKHDYVSRGALKLLRALEHFQVNPQDLICLDIGSSTGGFTEVLLRKKAQKVFAVDVGYGELHYKLRNNPRVSLLERTNARYLTTQQITSPPDLIVCDASFISLTTILPASLKLGSEKCKLIALIKPQFEVTKEEVGNGGIVRDPLLHHRVCNHIKQWLEDYNFYVYGIIPSPILGTKGNQEFLIYGKQRDKKYNPKLD